MKFTQRSLEALVTPGKFPDPVTPNLFLRIRGTGKSWYYRRMIDKRRVDIGLGAFKRVSLAAARSEASTLNGMNSSEFRQYLEDRKIKAENASDRRRHEKKLTFREAAKRFADWNIEIGNWQELDKAHSAFNGRMRMYILPIIGDIELDAITPEDVAAIARPIWHMPETVNRCLRFTRQVFNWSIAKKLTSNQNPAVKSGPLQFLLPMERHITRNRGAIAVAELPRLFKCIYDRFGNTASGRCFLFAVLTAVRSGTARNAAWEQIDLDNLEWIIPPEQLKVSENGSLIVPLPEIVVRWLRSFRPDDASGLLFPNRKGKALSDSMVSRLISDSGENWIDASQSARLGRDVRSTLHGVSRATFRTWAQDDSLGNDKRFDPRIAELCLHHKVKDIYNGAYERNQSFIRRREMMEEWAAFCFSEVDADF